MAGQTKLAAAANWRPTTFQLWHGRDEPPPHRTFLRLGTFTAYLEGADLRDLRFNGVELVRRLYFALRDENWDTIPGRLENLSLVVERDRFQIAFDSHHCNRDLDFRWHGIIRGDDAGIRYTMSGKANRAFRYCRIGFCVLHPPGEYAGRPFSGRAPQGAVTGALPIKVGPQRYEGGLYFPLFDAVSNLTVSLASGVEAEFDFVGDLFEMEDQRNWTDGSFKTYCTPLSLGYPHSASAGQSFSQRVSMTASGQPLRPVSSSQTVILSVGQPLGRKLPQLGLGMATHDVDISRTDRELLRRLNLNHLRVDLYLKDPDFGAHLARSERECDAFGCGLEVAIFLTNDAEADLGRLKAILPPAVPVARILVFHENEQVTSQQWIHLVRDRIAARLPGVPLAGGTNLYFAELNRSRPVLAGLDAVAYSMNPQVHASDERSLVENLEAQRETVESARTFCGGLPIVISPVTLKPRFNPDAVGPEPAPEPGQLPGAVDPRQMSLFAAAWTLGSIKQLTEGGAGSLTYYETTGWRGIKEIDSGCPVPGLFCSSPGVVFPVYHVFADISDLKEADLIACASADPLRVQVLALCAGSTHLLIANLTAEAQTCEAGPLAGDRATVRSLNATNAREAMGQPLEYRTQQLSVPIVSSTLTLELAPYSVTRVDLREKGS